MKAALQSLKIAAVVVFLSVAFPATSIAACTYDDYLEHLKLREGMRNCVYRDSLGKPTVCVGHLVRPQDNLSVGDCLSDAQCDAFLRDDAAGAWNAATSQASQSCCQDSCFVLALASVNYQLGTGWRSKFPATWNLIKNCRWDEAANALEGTLWNQQTPVRVDDFQAILRAGCGNGTLPPTQPGGGNTGTNPLPGGPNLPVISDSCGTCSCTLIQAQTTISYITQQHNETRLFITNQFKLHENWIFGANDRFGGSPDSFFELHLLPALMMMTEQLVTTGMEQMFIIGTFFDAKIQLDTQRLLQKKSAEAHRDYHPSTEMCVIGTTARGMVSADHNGEYTSFVLSQRSQDRQLGIYSVNGAHSAGIDREGRIRQVKNRYCDRMDNSGDMEELCETDDTVGAGTSNPENTKAASVNKDVDYTRTVDLPRTLHIDFADPALTGDEQDVLALGSNLFSYEVLDKTSRASGGLEASEGAYMAMRSIIAKRSVAEHSYNTIVGLKTAGTEESEKTIEFTEKILEQLGVENEDHRRILLGGTKESSGGTGFLGLFGGGGSSVEPALRPSYYAQLETLAQTIYQDPEFYSNLYDKPANVIRKDVAMRAINLMLERDLYKNEQRSEMVMSIWLEMELLKYQMDIQNRLNAMKEDYEQN